MHKDYIASRIEVFVPTPREAIAEELMQPRVAREPCGTLAIGLLDNHKHNSDKVLNHLEQRLRAQDADVRVVKATKPEAGKPAPKALMDDLAASCQIVITGIAD